MLDVSIIIVNYNTLKVTQECINSVVEKTQDIKYEIILVDNASTDGSKEFFEKDERVKYIYSKRNGGFGYGNNLGMKVAKGKYFFLLNSDTVLINNATKEFYDYAEKDDKERIYGCYLQLLNGSPARSYFFFPSFTIFSFLKRKFVDNNKERYDYQPKSVQVVSGANMFLNRKLFDITGGFDENIFLYGEECEWQYRLSLYGYHAFIIPYPKIIHLEGKSTPESIHKRNIILKSHFYILKKHLLYSTYLLARFYYAFNLTLRNLKNIENAEYREYWKTIYLGK